MTDEPSSKRKKGSDRPDGRRQLLVYLEASLLFDLKVKALREERPAYEIVEEALKLFMGSDDRSP